MTYKKITAEIWDYQRKIPKCPSKGAFEIAFEGKTYFVIDGKLHKDDGPVVVWPNGYKEYYQYGKLHRDDGPAIIYSSGTLKYFQHGELHRVDGPAVIFSDGTQFYYLFGQHYKKEQWETKILQINLKGQIV